MALRPFTRNTDKKWVKSLPLRNAGGIVSAQAWLIAQKGQVHPKASPVYDSRMREPPNDRRDRATNEFATYGTGARDADFFWAT